MSDDTIICPYCGATIKASDSRCYTCNKGWDDMTISGRKPRPIIGYVGLGVLLIGAAWTFLAESTASNAVFAVGVLIFAYAIIVGHFKPFR
jgi:hypothetical protein